MSLILDAGAFTAVERGDREVIALVKWERLAGRAPLTHVGVVGEIWRGGAEAHARVALLLAGLDISPLDEALGKRAGVLLGRSGRTDAIDSALVCLASDGDELLTSDPADLHDLARAAGVHIDLIPVA